MKPINTVLVIFLLLTACSSDDNNYDATGSFEAVERLISSEATGVIKSLNIEEGQRIRVGDTLGYVGCKPAAIAGRPSKSIYGSDRSKNQ